MTIKSHISFWSLSLLLIFVLDSCKVSDKVASSSFIQKRKYTNGYFTNLFQSRLNPKDFDSTNTTAKTINNSPTKINYLKNDSCNLNIASTDLLVSSNDYIVVDNKKPFVFPDNSIINNYSVNQNDLVSNNKSRQDTQLDKKLFSKTTQKQVTDPVVCDEAVVSIICSFLPLVPFAASWTGFIFIFFYLGAVFAVVFGIIALRKIKKDPTKWKGKGFALLGLVIGIIEILFFLLIFLVAFYLL